MTYYCTDYRTEQSLFAEDRTLGWRPGLVMRNPTGNGQCSQRECVAL
jgi:hypothetical protein